MQALNNFYCIEGIDGSGKTTLSHDLVYYLIDKEIRCEYTFEPTNSVIGKLIRSYLKKEIDLSDTSLLHLFAADRDNHLFNSDTGIVNKVNNLGYKIVCDRYLFSSIAYQSLSNDMMEIIEANKQFYLPEIVFFIDLKPEEALKRIESRAEDKERYDSLQILEKVYDNYIKAFKHYEYYYGLKVIKLDGNKSVIELVNECVKYII